MTCYKSGGCGVYEMRSCSECPASKPEYLNMNVVKCKDCILLDECPSGQRCVEQIEDFMRYCPVGKEKVML